MEATMTLPKNAEMVDVRKLGQAMAFNKELASWRKLLEKSNHTETEHFGKNELKIFTAEDNQEMSVRIIAHCPDHGAYGRIVNAISLLQGRNGSLYGSVLVCGKSALPDENSKDMHLFKIKRNYLPFGKEHLADIIKVIRREVHSH